MRGLTNPAPEGNTSDPRTNRLAVTQPVPDPTSMQPSDSDAALSAQSDASPPTLSKAPESSGPSLLLASSPSRHLFRPTAPKPEEGFVPSLGEALVPGSQDTEGEEEFKFPGQTSRPEAVAKAEAFEGAESSLSEEAAAVGPVVEASGPSQESFEARTPIQDYRFASPQPPLEYAESSEEPPVPSEEVKAPTADSPGQSKASVGQEPSTETADVLKKLLPLSKETNTPNQESLSLNKEAPLPGPAIEAGTQSQQLTPDVEETEATLAPSNRSFPSEARADSPRR